MGGAGKVVCVTGGSGYIASWLVKLLLQRGYTVNASVLDLNDPRQTQHLLSLDGAKERLHLFKADLMEDGAFDALIHGCEGVFHTACPVSVSPTEEAVVGPAVEGTLNVLRSCVKFACVKRVVITSSIVSVKCNEKPLSPDMVVDETWFSDPAFFKEMKLWYVVAKTLAEGAAWKFAKENGIDLVTLHPGLVTGPFLQPTLNLTVQYVLDLVTGVKPSLPPFSEFVDVRDVAHAHIQAFEVPSASGRYLIVGEVKNIYDVLKNLKQHHYPTLSLPEKWESDKPHQVSKMKAEALGVSFIPLEVSLRDTIESLKEKGFLNI